jgi:hypothetical protein
MTLFSRIRARATYANVTATLALFVALGGGSFAVAALSGSEKKVVKKIAKKQANKQITTRAPGLTVEHADSADVATPTGAAGGDLTGAYPNPAIADGAVTPQKTSMRWALVDSDGTILDQSGGISLTVKTSSNYYLDFGSNMAHKAIQVTIACLGLSCANGANAVAWLCGGTPLGATCPEPGTDDQNHVAVFTSDADGVDHDEAFYVTVF